MVYLLEEVVFSLCVLQLNDFSTEEVLEELVLEE